MEALRTAPWAFEATYEVEAALSESDWRQRAVRWRRDEGAVWLGAMGPGLAGMAVAVVEDRVAWIGAMYVRPAARRAGVGRALVDAAVEWAQEKRPTAIRAGVVQGNEVALRTLRAAGFHETGRAELLRREPELVEIELELSRAPKESGEQASPTQCSESTG